MNKIIIAQKNIIYNVILVVFNVLFNTTNTSIFMYFMSFEQKHQKWVMYPHLTIQVGQIKSIILHYNAMNSTIDNQNNIYTVLHVFLFSIKHCYKCNYIIIRHVIHTSYISCRFENMFLGVKKINFRLWKLFYF